MLSRGGNLTAKTCGGYRPVYGHFLGKLTGHQMEIRQLASPLHDSYGEKGLKNLDIINFQYGRDISPYHM